MYFGVGCAYSHIWKFIEWCLFLSFESRLSCTCGERVTYWFYSIVYLHMVILQTLLEIRPLQWWCSADWNILIVVVCEFLLKLGLRLFNEQITFANTLFSTVHVVLSLSLSCYIYHTAVPAQTLIYTIIIKSTSK